MNSQSPAEPSSSASPRWQVLGAMDRRVVGVLVEKAKTTPDIYPMSLNAVCTACNQKSNRDPLMQLEPDQVEEALDRLRDMGAVGLVEGSGRVNKYRHYLYEWLGVDKVELAVMTELLLRGDQTVGELRTRASRMEPIADLAALHAILGALKRKGLVVTLTPEGRGQVVTHALYKPREMENLRAKYSGMRPVESASRAADAEDAAPAPPAAHHSAPPVAPRTAAPVADMAVAAEIAGARRELEQLRTQVAQLQQTLEELHADHQRVSDELRTLKDALGA